MTIRDHHHKFPEIDGFHPQNVKCLTDGCPAKRIYIPPINREKNKVKSSEGYEVDE